MPVSRMRQGGVMKTAGDDILEFFDHVWARFRARMDGLGDEEWAWCPTPDPRVGLRWRIEHISATLREDRNPRWLGLAGTPTERRSEPRSAADALDDAAESFALWRRWL